MSTHNALEAIDRAKGIFRAQSDNGPERAELKDVADDIDKPHEQFADDFKVSLDSAVNILNWHSDAIARAQIEGIVKLLGQVIPILLERCKNREARDLGVAFAFGFAHRLNGVRDIAHAARQHNVERQLITRYKRRFDKLLPEGVRV